MKKRSTPRRLSRRDFLKIGSRGALFLALGGGTLSSLMKSNPSQAASTQPQQRLQTTQPPARPPQQVGVRQMRLAATDGYVSLPGRRIGMGGEPNGVYIFGFIEAATTDSIGDVIVAHKGKVQMPSPIIDVEEGYDLYMTLTNLGLEVRPDLDDAHTIHWHGFRNPNAVFDGVPEVSISVPVARDFPYFYRTRSDGTGAGTYMYHCHFEDTEHVQMGMDGIVFVRPTLGPKYAYNNPSTAFDREYTLLLNEIDTTPHDNLEAVQEFVWSDFKPNYYIINGRSYPDTLLTDQELDAATELDGSVAGDLKIRQPVSSLIQANEGEKILLRMACLGYEQHAMQMLGIRMAVVGHDANYLDDLSYETGVIYIGPGEARDVLFTAPAYNAALPGGTDAAGDYNVYWFKNRNYQRLVNGTESGLGGMVTQVRVYANGTLGMQDRPNQTFPKVTVV